MNLLTEHESAIPDKDELDLYMFSYGNDTQTTPNEYMDAMDWWSLGADYSDIAAKLTMHRYEKRFAVK